MSGRGILVALLVVWSGLAIAQDSPKFEIQRFVVDGNTLLEQKTVDELVAPFAGKQRDFGDVQRALEVLQEAYLSRGFNAVRVVVPEQELRSGVVRLQVIEARIRQVRVEGNKHFSDDNVRASMPSLVAGQPPQARRIGEGAQLVNDNPAKNVNVRLDATDQVGQVDATIRVTDYEPARYSLFMDNTGNSQTGQLRLGAGYQHANLFNRDHVLNAQVITSPENANDVKIVGVGYRIPMYEWRGAFDLIAGYSDVNSGTVSNLFNVTGSGSIAIARYTQYLPRIETYEQKVALGLDWRDYHQNVALIGTNSTLVPDYQVKPWTLSYLGRQSLVGREFNFVLSYSENIPGGADGNQDAITAQRPGAPARYQIWRLGGSYTQLFGPDIQFRAVINGQYTRDPLVPGEQFGMGGQFSVRGFFEREAVNDYGYQGSLELYSPDFGRWFGDDWRARMLVFADAAHGQDRDPQRIGEQGLGSAGLGFRINQGRSLAIRLDWGHVLNGTGTRPKNADRAHIAIGYSF